MHEFIGTWEGKFTLAFSSGCASITILMMLLENGDEVIASEEISGSARKLFDKVLSKKNKIKFLYIDCNDENLISKAINGKVKMVFLETPSNPCLRMTDIQKVSKICRKNKILLAVDSTFATPYLQNPLLLGADIVVHSCTKYICGHSDVVMGTLTLNDNDLYN